MHVRELLHPSLDAVWAPRQGRAQGLLLAQALAVAEELRVRTGAGGSAEVAVACRSVTSFAPAILGAFAAEATVHLLPNTQPGTLQRAAATSDVLLHDSVESQNGSKTGLFLPPLLDAPPAIDPGRFPGCARARVVFSTSGTTGTSAQSVKSLAQIQAETESLLPLLSGRTCVLATVPPYHLFGLLFGLLVPLRAGCLLVEEPGFFIGEIAAAMAEHAVDVLVSTPPHLSAMVEAAMPKGLQVFSSGAPLPDILRDRLATGHRWSITDVFGSTETGGIATRNGPRSRWTPLPGVRFGTDAAEPDRATSVSSPWCDGGSAHLNDVIRLQPDGTFDHEGRSDDVVKVGGKRASLEAIDSLLRGLPGIRDVAIWQDARRAGRLRVALVGIPMSKEDIRAAVARQFDPVFAPRQVVFVDALPREATGKLRRKALDALFPRKPVLRAKTVPLALAADDRIEGTLPPELIFFAGHFRGLPILPGSALVERVVIPAARLKYPELGVVVGLRRLRFVRSVSPSQSLSVRFTRSASRVTFEVTSAADAVATGMIDFREAAG